MRILIVSASADETHDFLEDLEDLQHEIFIVHDGARAMDIMTQQSPDVALICSRLPDMTGMELCRRRKEQEQEMARGFTHIILACCEGDNMNPLTAVKEAGAQDYIFLPLPASEDLAARIYLAERDKARESEIITDSLTQILNRRGLKRAAVRELARHNREGKRLAVTMLDINNFKAINDTYGHAGGDEVLSELGFHLRVSVRDYDLVGRPMGDEFVAVLLNIEDKADALRRARDIRRSVLERRFMHKTLTGGIRIDVSMGVVLSQPGDSRTPHDWLSDYEELLKKADAAMYQAKRPRQAKVRFAA